MTAPLFRADVQTAALRLARLYDGPARPTPRRLVQWQRRIRVWAHRYPDKVKRYGRIAQRTQYDLGQLEDVARVVIGAPR